MSDRGAAPTPTIRDRIKDAIIEIDLGFPGAARTDLLAALAILDNAPRGLGEYTYHVGPECRLVPDPDRETHS